MLFVYINVIQKYNFMSIHENYNDYPQLKTTCTFIYIQKKEGNKKFFLYSKSLNLTKSKTICVTFCIHKKSNTLPYMIFQEFFKKALMFKKHDTLSYVTFLYAKIQTFRKKQNNLRYFLMYKNPETLS